MKVLITLTAFVFLSNVAQASDTRTPNQEDVSAADTILCRDQLKTAEDLWAAEKISEAIAAYRRITSYNPALAKAWVALGTLYARVGNAADAKAAYRKALACQPDYPLADFYPLDPCSPAEKEVIKELVRLRPDLVGLTLFHEIFVNNPRVSATGTKWKLNFNGWQDIILTESAGALLVQAMIAASNGDASLGLLKCRKAAEIQPWWIVPLGVLDLLSLADEKKDPVLAYTFSELRGFDPNKLVFDSDFKRKLEETFRRIDRLDVERWAIRWPDSTIVRYQRIVSPRFPPENAREELEKIAAERPDSPAPHKALATLFVKTEDFRRASAKLQEAVLLEPLDWDSRLRLAILLVPQGGIREACDQLETVLLQHPGCADAHYFAGLVGPLPSKNYDAIAHLRAAVTLKPGDQPMRLALAGTLWNESFSEEALAHARIASRLNSNDAETHCLIGAILEKRGDIEGARSAFEKVLKCPQIGAGSQRSTDYARAALERLSPKKQD